MEIVLLGAGQVGATLAESLTKEGHDVAIVDINEKRLAELQQRFDIKTTCGIASYPEVQRSAGMETADLMVAVTDSDETNMVACQVAYSLFKTPMKIARIRSPQYFIRSQLFGDDDLPIDEFINPEQLVTQRVAKLIHHAGVSQVLDFANGLVKLVVVKPYYGGKFVGYSLQAFHYEFPLACVLAIYRGGEQVELRESVHIEVGDEVIMIASAHHLDAVLLAFRRMDKPYSDIMIAGGGNVGARLASALEGQYHIKLIDHNLERCETVANHLNNTTVLCGDASDKTLLVNENIDRFDVFCAVTDDDEANIMSALQAKRLGARQVMALVNRTTYMDLIADSEINVIISPDQVTISRILAFIRSGDVVRAYALHRGEIEVIEALARGEKGNSFVVGHTVQSLSLPKGVHIGAIVRDRVMIVPELSEVICDGDHVILFVAEKKYIAQVEQLFQSGL